LQLLLGGSVFTAMYLLVGLMALVSKRWLAALSLWFFVVLLLVAAWLTQQLSFVSVSGSPLALLSGAAVVVVALVSIFLDSLKRSWVIRTAAVALVALGFGPLAYSAATQQPDFVKSDGRVVPWLLVSQAESDARLLVISAEGGTYTAQWLPVRGSHLEDISTAYRFELNSLNQTAEYKAVADLVGDMVSANGKDISASLESTKVQFVLVPNDKSATVLEIGSSLDSVPQLESAGVTEFGRLWRVKDQADAGFTNHSVWSVTKGIQVTIIGAFLLLAIPSRARRKVGVESEIFVAGEEADV
jgi:hypothetical protein